LQRRTGRWLISGERCSLDLERTYFARGLEDTFLPTAGPPWPDVSALPPLPTEQNPTGASDDDGDGVPGIAFVVSRGASGVRNVAQRDYVEYFTDPSETDPKYQIVPDVLELDVRARFDNEESIIEVSQCPPVGCGPLRAGSRPAADLDQRVRMRYLGLELDEPRVQAVVTRLPREDLEADFATCEGVRTELPHDPSSE
jgi:hypothetical protein